MYMLLTVLGLVFFGLGLLLTGSIKSDIQLQILATCWATTTVLMGIAALIRRLDRVERMLRERAGKDTAAG